MKLGFFMFTKSAFTKHTSDYNSTVSTDLDCAG